MASEKDYQALFDRIAALREQVASRLSSDLVSNPPLADAITKQIDDMLASVVDADSKIPRATCWRRPGRGKNLWGHAHSARR